MINRDTVPMVYIVDDDENIRDSLSHLIRSAKFDTRAFDSAEAFLASYDGSPGVMICDVRMPGMTGLDLQESLLGRDTFMPMVLMTGYCRVPLVVAAIRNGAVTVLEKPFSSENLLLALHQSLDEFRMGIGFHKSIQHSRACLASLTTSERDVLRLLKSGLANKEIALELDLSMRTIAFRRKNIIRKMEVVNLVELFRIVALTDQYEASRERLRCPSRITW